MKRNEFMQPEQEEPKEKYVEPEFVLGEIPDIALNHAIDRDALWLRRQQPAIGNDAIGNDVFAPHMIIGPTFGTGEPGIYPPPPAPRPDFPVRTIGESDPEYVERGLMYIMDNSNLTNAYVRRILYQTLSSLTDIPREMSGPILETPTAPWR